MNTVVIGYGSIGSRHARILAELGCHVAVVSGRNVPVEHRFSSIEQALAAFAPEYVVVASETARHSRDVAALAESGYEGVLLVEKPLFHEVEEMSSHPFSGAFVAYNLRFHPLIRRLRDLLEDETIISIQAYVGQYLPTWRPQRDYRENYSAYGAAGGGVLRDLSHELDLLNWLLGGWEKLTALGGHFSSLEISSDDLYVIMMATELCPAVTLEMNYLDRVGRRRILVNTDRQTIEADLTTGMVLVNGERENFEVERDYTYRKMHQSLLAGEYHDVCSYAEGVDVVAMIAAVEQAAERGEWVAR